MTIESELLLIKGNKEMLQAEEVVEWARKHPRSELHGQFEWDDSAAAREYRIWQARRVIALHITFADGERKFISLSVDRVSPRGGYRDLDDVSRHVNLMQIALQDALNDLDRVQQRYDFLKALRPIWRATSKVKSKAGLAQRKTALRSRAKRKQSRLGSAKRRPDQRSSA